ncbi:hypothetical protein G6M87_09155 [Rhizobium rhizogenes]|uniref:hypothetical protein n=1 Tax=Rhizobium rhizogenes TaxID=359 RepID=UPI001572088B|nr:hypothetical protein [Rhizobium rhizogenes]NTI22029.1 hypothetical protein [Rhizobium rhizogenes]QTG05635.1 hypothetical protein G6M87_09155 [Rhizobium rhizogenes]
MNVGRSVSKTIDEWMAGDSESAMLHACNAIDGTARKKPYASIGNAARFRRIIREDLEILGKFGMPGINLETTKFPISISGKPTAPMDIADILYKVHRCTHGHGDELENGFTLLADAAGPPRLTHFVWDSHKLMLSDRMLFGMIAIAIVAPENASQKATDGHYLTFDGGRSMPINDWWGRRDDMLAIVRSVELSTVHMDFSTTVSHSP